MTTINVINFNYSIFPGYSTLKIPTHFFAVITKKNESCSLQPCSPDEMIAFILPHDSEERMACQVMINLQYNFILGTFLNYVNEEYSEL